MGFGTKFLYATALLTVILCLFVDDVDSRRVILKGRKSITRKYFYNSLLPAWLLVLLVALAEVVFGGILYLILKRVMIDPPIAGFYSVQRGENTSMMS